jgi:hypothetical protein
LYSSKKGEKRSVVAPVIKRRPETFKDDKHVVAFANVVTPETFNDDT